jgi:hypothetical protein
MKYRLINQYKYQLIGDHTEHLSNVFCKFISTDWITVNGDKITIKSGYCWDGASCAIDTKDFMVASLVHDALYQLIRLEYVSKDKRKLADLILNELCLKYGMSKFRASYVYWAVRTFGGKHIQIGKPQDTIVEIQEG